MEAPAPPATARAANATAHAWCRTTESALLTAYGWSVDATEEVGAAEQTLLLVLLVVASACFLFAGGRIVRPAAVATAATFGLWLGVVAVGGELDAPCTTRLVSGLIAALALGFCALCMIKVALFVLGAAAFGAVAHFVFVAFPPLETLVSSPVIEGRALVYWGALVVAGACGGFLARRKSKTSLQAITSLIGAAGIGVATHRTLALSGTSEEEWPGIAASCLAWAVGMCVQRHFDPEEARTDGSGRGRGG